MRKLIIGVAIVLPLTLLFAFRWTRSGELLWNPGTGEIKASSFFSPSPRWRWQSSGGVPLSAAIELPTASGETVQAGLRWTPPKGTLVQLVAADYPATAFKQVVEDSLRTWSEKISFGCFFAALAEPDCPPNPASELAQQVAAALTGSGFQQDKDLAGSRLGVEFTSSAQSMKRYLARGIRATLPSRSARVVVMAVDGLDWDFVQPLSRSGRMPNLTNLLQAGTWGTMETLVPILSPLIWTSVATGVSPDQHGILDFVERDPETGQVVPVSARSRKSPTIWEMASVLGKRVGVIGWWASWPATELNGTLVSDRLYYTLTQGIDKSVFSRDPEHLVYPASRTEEFTSLRNRAVEETNWQVVNPFMAVPADEYAEAVAADAGMEDPIDGFRRIVASTRTYMGSGLLVAQDKPDLLMAYLEGTDTVGHLLARYQSPPVDADVSVEEASRYSEAIPRYYQAADRWIGRYLQECPLSECTWILVSDHGFKWGDERPRGLGGFSGRTAPLWHATDASFAVAGVGTRRLGQVSDEASVYDVAPTIAAALGIPADESWTGKPLPGSPTPAALPAVDYSGLTVLPREQFGAEVALAQDPEFIAKLQALGYLGGDSTVESVGSSQSSAPVTPESTPASPASGVRTRGELNNLAVLKINEKEYEEAEALLREAIELSPEYPSPHYNLRRMYIEMGRHDDADRELWISVDKGLRSSERSLDQAAADYDILDLPERSATILTGALQRFPGHEPLHVHYMVVLIRLEECKRAAEVGAAASSRFPASAPVHAFYGLGAACAGDIGAAREALEISLALNSDQPRLHQVLSDLEQ